jgi:hypothetical protein
MAQQEYTDYQRAAISNYYKNLDTIMLQKLDNLVSELYIAEIEGKADKLWPKVRKAMEKLNIPEAIINHIVEKHDVGILAKNLQEWQSKCKK